MTPEELSTHIDAYDAELRCLDDRLRDLFSELERMDALDNTLVVIAGDHGEGFGEHGFFDHANSLYEEEVHVPLIVREPGQRSGVRVSRRVHTVDVMPTILRILGISIPAGMEGGDLFLGGRTIADVASLGPYSRAYSEYAVYEGNLKLVLRTDAAAQLFDLAADPREQSDLAAVRPGDVTRLTTLFDEYVQRPGRRFRSDSSAIDADTRERLESLGYADH
jgi:arylsulfatase A-like enzyme